MVTYIIILLVTLLVAAYIVHQQMEKRHKAEIDTMQAKLDALEAQRTADQESHVARVAEMLQRHEQELGKARVDAVETSRRVIRGQVAEQLVPFMPGFQWNPSDCKFMGQPVDIIIFEGMSDFRDGMGGEITVLLGDIKTGRARTTPVQKAIKRAIEEGRVRWIEIRAEKLQS